MVAVSLAASYWIGPLYGVAALLLGGVFLYEVHRLYALSRREQSEDAGATLVTMRLFHLSVFYLTLLFVAVAINALIH
jgi:protoheme IX farnesyltransferase